MRIRPTGSHNGFCVRRANGPRPVPPRVAVYTSPGRSSPSLCRELRGDGLRRKVRIKQILEQPSQSWGLAVGRYSLGVLYSVGMAVVTSLTYLMDSDGMF